MSIFTIKELKFYFAKPICFLLIDEKTDEPKTEKYYEKVNNRKVEKTRDIAQPYIDAAIEMVQAMGFHCVANADNIWKPIIAAFAQSHLQQNANQNQNLPYSTIQIEYENAMKFLKENPNICNNKSIDKPFNLFASRSNRGINAGL